MPTHPPINPPRQQLPRRFDALAALVPAQAIQSEAEHAAAIEMIDQLMRINRLSAGQKRYLETMLQLVEAYERQHHTIEISDLSGVAMLGHLMEQTGMSVEDLGGLLGVSRSHAYNLIRGARALTVEHLKLLAARFKVEPSLFL